MRIKAPNGVEVNGAEVRDVQLPYIGINSADPNGGTEASFRAVRFIESGGRRLLIGQEVQSVIRLGQIPTGSDAEKAAIALAIQEQIAGAPAGESQLGQTLRQVAELLGGDAAAYLNLAAAAVYLASQAAVTAGLVKVDPEAAAEAEG
jgi:hypothetical protein